MPKGGTAAALAEAVGEVETSDPTTEGANPEGLLDGGDTGQVGLADAAADAGDGASRSPQPPAKSAVVERQEALPDDEWTPTLGTPPPTSQKSEVRNVDMDEEPVRPKVEPPPPDVFAMLEKRRDKVQAAYDLVHTVLPTLPGGEGDEAQSMAPLYKVTSVMYYDNGIRAYRNTTPCTFGLPGAYSGKVSAAPSASSA